MAAGIGERTDHFNIRYADMQYLTPGTGKILENAYRSVNSYLGNLPGSIKVIVVDNDRMDDVGKHVEAFSAWNHQSSTIVLRGDTIKDPASLSVVVKHEICHLGLNDLIDKKDEAEYRWMEEGVCMVISGEPLDDVKVSKYIVNRGFMSTGQIGAAVDSHNYSVTKNGYLQSFSLCKYLSQTYGTEALVDILKSPIPRFEDAFYERTGEDFGQFYDRWVAHVQAQAVRSPGVKVVTIRGYLDLSMDQA
ncbi:peptidase MA family metallohydrolase [Methanocella sp. MCL-LM]|uniref:peptidase MA family metallohydrolase n=1 Tax=Methanocella sp. MCL-LM TaxID=3412035 RepID=UPI003C72A08E